MRAPARRLAILAAFGGAACAGGGARTAADAGALPATGPATTTTSVVLGTTESVGGTMTFHTTRDESGVSVTLPASPDRAWSALWSAYQALELAPTLVQQQQRRLGRDGLEPKGGRVAGLRTVDVVNCGTSPAGAPLAQSYAVRISLASAVTSAGEGARVTTRLLATASSRAIAGPPVTCGSTGRLETRLAELAAEQLRR